MSGTLASGGVLVIGDAETGEYLLTQGIIRPNASYTPTSAPTGTGFFDAAGHLRFYKDSFTFNGDDALDILLSETRQDVFGTIGVDPGTAWTGSGVSTAGQNIELRPYIGTGSSGFSNPARRYLTVSSSDALTGFGLAPTLSDDYLSWATGFGLTGTLRSPDTDADGDGILNLAEYGFGANPTSADAIPQGVLRSGQTLFLVQQRRTARQGLIFNWESSTDLTQWNPASLTLTQSTALSGTLEQLTWSTPINVPHRFWRTRVER
jgi:hypothetical protein